MINIIYPYSKTESKWHELEYSIKSINKYLITHGVFRYDLPHLKPYHIIIMGEHDPKIENTSFLYHAEKENWTTEENNGGKLDRCCDMFSDSEFLWMNDDIYFLKPTIIEDIINLNQKPLCNMQGYKNRGEKRWQRLLWKSHDLLVASQLFSNRNHHVYNFATHTPFLFNANQLAFLAQSFPIFQGEALPEVIYFNYFNVNNEKEIEIMDEKAGFYGAKDAETTEQIAKAMQGKRYMNHDDAGLTDALKITIRDLFDN